MTTIAGWRLICASRKGTSCTSPALSMKTGGLPSRRTQARKATFPATLLQSGKVQKLRSKLRLDIKLFAIGKKVWISEERSYIVYNKCGFNVHSVGMQNEGIGALNTHT